MSHYWKVGLVVVAAAFIVWQWPLVSEFAPKGLFLVFCAIPAGALLGALGDAVLPKAHPEVPEKVHDHILHRGLLVGWLWGLGTAFMYWLTYQDKGLSW